MTEARRGFCRNCLMHLDEHLDEKCLYDVTFYEFGAKYLVRRWGGSLVLISTREQMELVSRATSATSYDENNEMIFKDGRKVRR